MKNVLSLQCIYLNTFIKIKELIDFWEKEAEKSPFFLSFFICLIISIFIKTL